MATEHASLRLPERSLLADDVYEILRENLVSGAIAPGARLNLDDLARRMHVSNTPVRQALARLESEWLVTREPYRGFTASQLLDSRTINELYEYRLILEPPTAARAARLAPGEKAQILNELCDPGQIEKLANDEAWDEVGLRDCDFHFAISELAENRVISENVRNTLGRTMRFATYNHPGAWSHAWEEHRAITSAIIAGDPQGAADKMRTHLKLAHKRMSTAIPRGSERNES